MNRRRRTYLIYALLFIAVCLLTGCSAQQEEEEPWVPTQTAISAGQDGILTETLIVSLDEDYYVPAELKSMAEEAVRDYTAEYGADTVRLDSFEAEGSSIRMVMVYRSPDDYAAFNNVRFYNGTMLGAQMAGFRMETNYHTVNADDGTSSRSVVSFEEPLSHKEYHVLVSDLEHMLEIPGTVRYVSENASVTDGRYVYPDQAADTASTGTQGNSQADGAEAGQMIVIYDPVTETNTKDIWKKLFPFLN